MLDTPIAPGYMRDIGIRDYAPMARREVPARDHAPVRSRSTANASCRSRATTT